MSGGAAPELGSAGHVRWDGDQSGEWSLAKPTLPQTIPATGSLRSNSSAASSAASSKKPWKMREVRGRQPYENPKRQELRSPSGNPRGAGCTNAANSRLRTSAPTHGQGSWSCPIICSTLRPTCTGSPTEKLTPCPTSVSQSIPGTRQVFFSFVFHPPPPQKSLTRCKLETYPLLDSSFSPVY